MIANSYAFKAAHLRHRKQLWRSLLARLDLLDDLDICGGELEGNVEDLKKRLKRHWLRVRVYVDNQSQRWQRQGLLERDASTGKVTFDTRMSTWTDPKWDGRMIFDDDEKKEDDDDDDDDNDDGEEEEEGYDDELEVLENPVTANSPGSAGQNPDFCLSSLSKQASNIAHLKLNHHRFSAINLTTAPTPQLAAPTTLFPARRRTPYSPTIPSFSTSTARTQTQSYCASIATTLTLARGMLDDVCASLQGSEGDASTAVAQGGETSDMDVDDEVKVPEESCGGAGSGISGAAATGRGSGNAELARRLGRVQEALGVVGGCVEGLKKLFG